MSNFVVKLSLFLENAKKVLKNLILVDNGVSVIRIVKFSGNFTDPIEVKIPLCTTDQIDIDYYFKVDRFLNNYQFVFGEILPANVVSNLTNIPATIQNDLTGISKERTITQFFSLEYNLFRQLTCVVFNMFNIALNPCVCVPSTYSELILLSRGVGINCYKTDCADAIKRNPRVFDVYCSTNCNQQICMQSILINVLSGGSVNIDVNAKQQCESIINTVINNGGDAPAAP